MGDHHHLKRPSLYLAIPLLMMMIMIPTSTSHSALDSPESNSPSFFHSNGSSAECFGRDQVQADIGLEFLMESETSKMVLETRRMLQQRGRPTTNALKLPAACGRDKFGYLCTPPSNKDVKRAENCRRTTYNRNCHLQPK